MGEVEVIALGIHGVVDEGIGSEVVEGDVFFGEISGEV